MFNIWVASNTESLMYGYGRRFSKFASLTPVDTLIYIKFHFGTLFCAYSISLSRGIIYHTQFDTNTLYHFGMEIENPLSLRASSVCTLLCTHKPFVQYMFPFLRAIGTTCFWDPTSFLLLCEVIKANMNGVECEVHNYTVGQLLCLAVFSSHHDMSHSG